MKATGLRFSFGGLLVVLLMSQLAGCAAFSLGNFGNQEEIVRQRAEARWDAVIALDFDKVYEFASPEYRAVFDKRHLQNQYAAQIERLDYDVVSITFDENDPKIALVAGNIHFNAYGLGRSGKVKLKGYEVETWVRRNGKWWYVEKR